VADFIVQLRPFIVDRVDYDPAAVAKHLQAPALAEHVSRLANAFEALDRFDATSTEESLRGTAAAQGVKAATLIHATRVALTGQAVSPGLFEMVALVGRRRTIERLRQLERFLRESKG
jgi:glutamyl-tRNA synthetase